MSRATALAAMVLWSAALAGVAGCASSEGPVAETTMLGSVDLIRMTDQMAASLLASGVDLTGAVIVADRVVNRTAHIMPPGEKELFLVRLRAMLNQNPALDEAGVVFVARPDELAEASEPMTDDSTGRGPTHALTATFYTLTHVTRMEREDTYEAAFQLQNLSTREVVWEDAYTVRYVVERGRHQ